MIGKVRSCMQEYGMFPVSKNIVVGVSGGADSVCLLRALVSLREEFGLNLTAVHVNHKIRREAGEDADFVKKICAEWHVPFVLVEEDVEALAARERLSCEEAGRRVRYEAFERTLAQMDAGVGDGIGSPRGCIAVAHNSDDRAETLLFHMLRGTGLTGMGSIRPVRRMEGGVQLIRPLLFCTRQEIEDFLKKEGIPWRTDATNAEDMYTRNRIRNRILPYACEHVSGRAREHLVREAQLLSETSDFVDRMTEQAMARCCDRTAVGKLIFDLARFREEDPFLQEQMVLKGMLSVGTGKDLTAVHVEQARNLFEEKCQSGRMMEVPSCMVRVVRQFGQVVMQRLGSGDAPENGAEKDAVSMASSGREYSLREGRQLVPGLGGIEAEIFEIPGEIRENPEKMRTFLQDIPEKTYTKWLDYDKISESAVFRSRRVGDYLTINQKGDKKSLKRYLIEEKIPADRRDELIFLADGAHVMWVPGHRISAAYKVTAQTKRVLRLYTIGGEKDGRES